MKRLTPELTFDTLFVLAGIVNRVKNKERVKKRQIFFVNFPFLYKIPEKLGLVIIKKCGMMEVSAMDCTRFQP